MTTTLILVRARWEISSGDEYNDDWIDSWESGLLCRLPS
jgi:hypothetical protein